MCIVKSGTRFSSRGKCGIFGECRDASHVSNYSNRKVKHSGVVVGVRDEGGLLD